MSGDLVSLYSMEAQLKKSLGRKQVQLESDVERGEARILKGAPPTTLYLQLPNLCVMVTAGHYHFPLPMVQ